MHISYLRGAIGIDKTENDERFQQLGAQEFIGGKGVRELQKACRHRICDDILLQYLDEHRLDDFPHLKDKPVHELLHSVQQEIVLVLENVEALEQQELAENHLLRIVEDVSTLHTFFSQQALVQTHPEYENVIVSNILPMRSSQDVLKDLSTHLQSIRRKVLPQMDENTPE